jgi:hypothetical protein
LTLLAILAGTLVAGIGSVWLAAALSFGALGRYTQHMLSLAAGALMATAFMHLLPEAFESQAGARDLFLLLLVGLVFFFLLDTTTTVIPMTTRMATPMARRSSVRPVPGLCWPVTACIVLAMAC